MTRRIKSEVIFGFIWIAASSAVSGQQSATAPFATNAAIDQQRRSLFAQRASLKRQMGENNFSAFLGTTFYGTTHGVSFACPPLQIEKREDLIFDAARAQAIEPGLLRAVMHRESGFHPCAVSVKGALGLMQLMPDTLAQFHVTNAFDPVQSVHAGAALLRTLLDKYQGDLRLTLAAYNAGAARVDSTSPDRYPAETKNYIADILAELGIESAALPKPVE
jgi:hypothetical protein